MSPKNVCNFKENIRWSETITDIKLNQIYNYVQVYGLQKGSSLQKEGFKIR